MNWKPDPTFYASPEHAMEAPQEKLAYVAMLNPTGEGTRDAIGVVDTDPASKSYGRMVGQVDLPGSNNELHHFGWNACSSHLYPYAPHAHVERRYLVVPGTHTTNIHVIDTKPDPRNPELVKVIDGAEASCSSRPAERIEGDTIVPTLVPDCWPFWSTRNSACGCCVRCGSIST